MSSLQNVAKRLNWFQYSSPISLGKALSILSRYGKEARVLAGGTDLLPMIKLRELSPKIIISLNGISGLDYIRPTEKGLTIGSMTKIISILNSDCIKEKFYSIYQAAAVFATPQVRNKATIGGNICRSSPGADMIPPLMSLGAMVVLKCTKGKRKILLEDFLMGPGQNLIENEILSEIEVPLSISNCGMAFKKIVRTSTDLAKINCAAKISLNDGKCTDIRIVVGALAPKAIRARGVEKLIKGRQLSNHIIDGAAQNIVEEIKPITDGRSTAEYRAYVSKVIVKRTIKDAVQRIRLENI